MSKKLLLAILVMSFSFAAKKQKKEDLTTEMSFSGMSIHGRYNLPSEASFVSEDDKKLNDLITIRKQFKDRIGQEIERN